MASQKIGRYEILNELGQGGMAIVYLARDPFMNRQVAIKVLPRQFTFDPQFRARFKREAEAVASLEHPAIVPVYDYGEADEQPFIVMRYMPGATLQDRIGKPEARTGLVTILTRVAQALDEAHSRGIVHRDLKPSNVLFDAWGEAYLSDFGIAKLAESTGTYSGSMMLGTPAYMSPEQARGERNIDGRSDIYSLGVLLFELLSGRKPYEADTPMGIAVKHVTEPVPSVLAAKPDLPEEYERIIAKAMAKDREARYQTASDLARAVTGVMTGANTVTPPLPATPPEVTRVAVVDTPMPAPVPPMAAPVTGVLPPAVEPAAAAAPLTAAGATVFPAAAKEPVAAPPTVASSIAPTPVPLPAPRAARPRTIGIVVGLALLTVLALGSGAFAMSWFTNRATPTPTTTSTIAATATAPAATLTAVVVPPTETRTAVPPTATKAASLTAAPSNTPAPSETATLASTATRTQAAVVTTQPNTQAPTGCLALPAAQQADCFAAGTAEAAAERTQNALDATAGVSTEQP